MSYWIIRCSEDGEVSIAPMERIELEQAFINGEVDPENAVVPAKGIYDLASGEAPLIIIEGKVIKPKPATKVTRWEI
jgi:hypothetical protein